MSEELKPCPFCGTKEKVKHASGPNGYHKAITCIRCGCLLHAEEWNDRPIEAALQAKINAAEARCKSALALYEEYHDVNIELRAKLARKDEEIKALENIARKAEIVVGHQFDEVNSSNAVIYTCAVFDLRDTLSARARVAGAKEE